MTRGAATSRTRAPPAWRDWWRQSGGGTDFIRVGKISTKVTAALRARGIKRKTARVTIRRAETRHALRDPKRAKGAGLDEADFDRLPEIVANPEAVLFDEKDPALIYVFRPSGRTGQKGKVVVRVDFEEKQRDRTGKRRRAITNSIRTAGYVQPENLRGSRYRVFEGEME